MLNDISKFRSLLKGVEVIDISSFGSAISPEYLINLLSEASWNGRFSDKFGFIGASLPGAGWHGGFNDLLNCKCVDWVIGGFFGAARRISNNINNNVEVHNLPQGIIAKLMTQNEREINSHIGVDTFIDPRIRGSLLNENTSCKVQPATYSSDNKLNYVLPDNDLVLLRGAGFDKNGSIVLETNNVDLDTLKIIKAALSRKAKIVIQVPDKIISGPNLTTVDRDLFSEVFIAPSSLHKTSFMNERYLTINNPCVTRDCNVTESLASILDSRIVPTESLIVGIGLPVSVINKYVRDNPHELDINIESGNRGGIIVDGDGFGICLGGVKPISQLDMFERIWNGEMSHALLGVGEIDIDNKVNVAHLAGTYFGVGGFLDIVQSVNKITFCSRRKERRQSIGEFICFGIQNRKDVAFLEA